MIEINCKYHNKVEYGYGLNFVKIKGVTSGFRWGPPIDAFWACIWEDSVQVSVADPPFAPAACKWVGVVLSTTMPLPGLCALSENTFQVWTVTCSLQSGMGWTAGGHFFSQ